MNRTIRTHFNTSFRNELNDFRKYHMLYLMDALFKGFERVFLFDVHRTLRDDRTAIVLFVGE